MYNNSKGNKDFLNGEEKNLMTPTTIEKLQETQLNSNAVSVKDLVDLLSVNSCIPIIKWIKEGKIQTTGRLNGTTAILEEPIVLIESVKNFIEQEDVSFVSARKRRMELETTAWLNIEEDEIERDKNYKF
ncbi:hypothetical protein [Bacillus mycoides]|uniref:hypothetical protein n=1 Tax=Bacillus cereus group TaxID=86661 RepID=UPI0001A0A705|nr:hypothetical protein [Bacillus mycoides]EEL48825.1 hypothetical protein bcere0022_39140 [Bacillus cereus Rock3-44]